MKPAIVKSAAAFCFICLISFSFSQKVYSNGKFHEKAEQEARQNGTVNAVPQNTQPSLSAQTAALSPEISPVPTEETSKASFANNIRLLAFLIALSLVIFLANYVYTKGAVQQSHKN